jgi:sugar fermentation stimulation protein A
MTRPRRTRAGTPQGGRRNDTQGAFRRRARAARGRAAGAKRVAAGLVPAGVYVVVFHLPRARTIRIGRLGRFFFDAGRYAYVGSAQRGLAKRVARHARRRKTVRWHVDYLARWATVEAAYAWPLPKRAECRLAARLVADGARRTVPRFGASDCRCAGHLVRLRGPADVARLRKSIDTRRGAI